jgi:hypothetical protein
MCDQCRETWVERNQRGIEGEPDCDGCKVELKKENRIAAHIYQLVRGQQIFLFNGERNIEYDISHPAIWSAIDHYPRQIISPWDVFEKVLHVYHIISGERRANADT